MEPFIFNQVHPPFFSLNRWQDEFPHLVVGISAKLPEEHWSVTNYAFHVGNNPERVIQKRKELTKNFPLSFDDWTSAEQVHGTKIRVVKAEDRGKGRLDQDSAIPGTDGLITFESDLLLASFYADCVPLYFYSPDLDLIGIAHAGWRGTVHGIGPKMIEQMVQLGAVREQIRVAIGPSIGMCCYEVDEVVIRPLIKSPKNIKTNQQVFVETEHPGRYRLDLKQTNLEMLRSAGVSSKHMMKSQHCTSCQSNYFHSYRRDQGDTGRMVAWIGKKGEGLIGS